MSEDQVRKRPVSKLSILLETVNGERFDIPFRRDLDWTGWNLMHMQLQADQRKAFAGGGIFMGLRLTNCLPDAREAIFLDNLSFFKDCYESLFLALSPRFEETLPNIPDPAAIYRNVAAKYLMCYYAVYDRLCSGECFMG